MDQFGMKQSETAEYKDHDEYFAALEKWMNEAYQWQCAANYFPFVLANHCSSQNPTSTTARAGTQEIRIRAEVVQGGAYTIPPLWKRFAAEMVDFILLFAIKLFVTFIAIDYLQVISNIDQYSFEFLQKNMQLNYQLFQLTTEIIILEIVHRTIVCIYETICLHRGNRTIGGATPGKSIMGIKVILCDQVIPLDNRRVVVLPGRDLGLWYAFARSVIKNFSLAFFIPVSFTLFLFQHNRTAYDILCRSIVVEDPRWR